MSDHFFQIRAIAIVLGFFLLLPGCVQQSSVGRVEVGRHIEAEGRSRVSTVLPLSLSGVAQSLQEPDGTDSALEGAVNASLDHVMAQPSSEVAVYLSVVSDSDSVAGATSEELPGQTAVTYADMQTVLQQLQTLLPAIENQGAVLQSEFRWVLVGSFGFTGYYEPVIQASHTASGPFQVPLYSAWGNQILAWVRSSVDSAILQLQGSGQIDFQDGTQMFVAYSGIGSGSGLTARQILAANNLLPDKKVRNLNRWIDTHPEAHQAILRAADPHRVFAPAPYGPRGSMGTRLSSWISAATDQTILPNGLVTVMQFSIPGLGDFQGLMLPQDTGGGIIGNRVDVFCGSGYSAESSAFEINTTGSVYVLLPKGKR